jgi:hypothetical protein
LIDVCIPVVTFHLCRSDFHHIYCFFSCHWALSTPCSTVLNNCCACSSFFVFDISFDLSDLWIVCLKCSSQNSYSCVHSFIFLLFSTFQSDALNCAAAFFQIQIN